MVHGFNMAYVASRNAHPILGHVIANLIGAAISYQGTRSWAFRHRTTTRPDGGRTAFVTISVATLAIVMACLWISRNALGLDDPLSDNISADVIGLGLAMLHGSCCRGSSSSAYTQRPSNSTACEPQIWLSGVQSSVHWCPSSATRSRTSGRLRPTTLW